MLYLLHQAVDRAAKRDPGHEAVRCGGECLTYGELAAQSAQVANVLRAQGVRRGDRVAIYATKGLRTTAGMYGIMTAGAAYVPLDPASPQQRIEQILRDCSIRHVISEPSRADVLQEVAGRGVSLHGVIGLEEDSLPGIASTPWSEVYSAPDAPPQIGTTELDLAYILYTSGSTGVPKGVMHTHRSALAWAEMSARTYGFVPTDRIGNHAPLHFDLSTLDYFASAVAGATTVVIPAIYTRLPASFSQFIQDERLTVLYAVPLALTQLLLHGVLESRDLTEVRWVLFGGEPFPPAHLRSLMRAMPDAAFSNVYGPTEVNGITHWPVPPIPDDEQGPIPIGWAYDNVDLLILNEHDEVAKTGEIGELLARTPTMMKGYWRRPDLDEGAFWSRKAAGGYEEVFHRTGDLVRVDNGGTLIFIGRKDRQVKVRGHRIELDEVEAALTAHPAVESAGVFVVPTQEGSQKIMAVATLRTANSVDVVDLLSHAAERLPTYAIPENLELVDVLPRTTTGKIDRRALRELALAAQK